MLPSARRVGVLGHATNPVFAKAMLDEPQTIVQISKVIHEFLSTPHVINNDFHFPLCQYIGTTRIRASKEVSMPAVSQHSDAAAAPPTECASRSQSGPENIGAET
jgi:hypothetical protein